MVHARKRGVRVVLLPPLGNEWTNGLVDAYIKDQEALHRARFHLTDYFYIDHRRTR